MSFIRASTQGDALKIMLPDGFDLPAGMLLWALCGVEDKRYRRYLIDFSRVREIRDSGLAWLMMLKKRVDASGLQLELVNQERRIAARARLAGLDALLPAAQNPRRARTFPALTRGKRRHARPANASRAEVDTD